MRPAGKPAPTRFPAAQHLHTRRKGHGMIVTACCESTDILQDAYIDPNTDEPVSRFDEFVCYNSDCESYLGTCHTKTVADDLTGTART